MILVAKDIFLSVVTISCWCKNMNNLFAVVICTIFRLCSHIYKLVPCEFFFCYLSSDLLKFFFALVFLMIVYLETIFRYPTLYYSLCVTSGDYTTKTLSVCKRKKKLTILRRENRTKRLQWPRSRQDWSLNDWKQIFCSDEPNFRFLGKIDEDLEFKIRTKF